MKSRIISISLAVMLALSVGLVACGGNGVPEVTEYNLTISSTEGGSVTDPGEGTSTYNESEVVNLVTEADEGCRFVNWTGDVDTIADVNAASTTIIMDGNYEITASFEEIPEYDLLISSTAGGLVSTPGEGAAMYDEGTVVDLVVEAEEGYWFVNWTGDVSTIGDVDDGTTTITMNGDYSITANFEEIPEYYLIISSTEGGSVTEPGEGNFAYDHGTLVDLVAKAEEGYWFVGWTGDVGAITDVSAPSTNVTMNKGYSVTAKFEEAERLDEGVAWLVAAQNSEGSWGGSNKVACTAFAVLKLEDRAFEQGTSPFDGEYEYSQQVTTGLNYIFSQADTYELAAGICLGKGDHVTCETGIAMMAIAASRNPDRVVNVPASIVDGYTYKETLEANIEFFASYQEGNGSWRYEPFGSKGCGDNNNTGYVVLGLAYAEEPVYGFNCTIPEDVKSKLDAWIDYVQVDGATPHSGGSGYGAGDSNSNVLRAGGLIFEMAFVGDTPDVPRMQRALDFLSRAWNDPDWLWEDTHSYPGWYGNPDWQGEPETEEMPDWWLGLEERWWNWMGPHYQAMYWIKKGLTYAGIDTISVDDIDVNWYDAFVARILYGQNEDGSWDRDYWGDSILATEWALLTLEKGAQQSP